MADQPIDPSRAMFEAAVVARMKESGFLEIEIRTECLARCDEGYQDEIINAGWHYWQAGRTSVEADTGGMAIRKQAFEEAARIAVDSADGSEHLKALANLENDNDAIRVHASDAFIARAIAAEIRKRGASE